LLCLLLLELPPCLRADASGEALGWLNGLRETHGLAPLGYDPLLARVAAAYAAELAQRGELSHRDERGRDALERYRAQGGVALRVGEILGSGASLEAVAAAWEASVPHRELALRRDWTHAGAGVVMVGGQQLWVLLFAAHLVQRLHIRATPDGGLFLVTGRFPEGIPGPPVLLSGLEEVAPELWSEQTRCFRFQLPASRGDLYHRLGYVDAAGSFHIGAAFYPGLAATSSKETAPQ
jgi:hypothetical protein